MALIPLLTAMLVGCALPPANPPQWTVATSGQAPATQLERTVARELEKHPGLTGIDPLVDPLEAFAARVDLARSAQRSLDVQYYIWRNDLTGTLLLEELREAADRGVRVRLLLDDDGIPWTLDDTLAALDAHSNIEVRLFNPFKIRRPKFIGFLTDFARLNRRMHNKSYTADGAATIIGGRNIGDEYFGATDGVVFADLDVLAIGTAAVDVTADFDRYWDSASSYPVGQILASAPLDEMDALDRKALAVKADPAASAYTTALEKTTDVRRLLDGALTLEWARTRLVSDDPAKGLNGAPPETLVIRQLQEILGEPTRELDLVSPYFVPAEAGTRYFTQLAGRDVAVRVLTNSLEATDIALVHSGYARRRVELLSGGVELFELVRFPDITAAGHHGANSAGSGGSSLHAKTFAVDAKRVFVGSLNFDQRSANLNTEMGLVIESPDLASRIEAIFRSVAPQLAYSVHLNEKGKVYWIKRNGDALIRYDKEPNSTWMDRCGVWFFSILPIEWLL